MHFPRALALLALVLCGFLAACETAPEPTGPGPLASVRIAAPALKISQTAVDVFSRYSYSVSAAQYPVAMNFEKTGNTPDLIAYSEPATLVLSIAEEGAESEVTVSSLVGRFDAEQIKKILEKIKLEATQR